MKQYDVVALGELLIDFTENGVSSQGNPVLEANPGGAPCNVLAMLTKLGRKTAFIGKVGKDQFGSQLEEALVQTGIDTAGLKMDDKVHTTLAFVHTLEGGDREFSFYRNPGADMMLAEEDVDCGLIGQCRIFHFGTLSMTHESCRNATKLAVRKAKECGKIISFDPNLRFPLWEDLEELREQVLFGLKNCDILKISDNEILWFTGAGDYDEAVEAIRREYNIPLILLSLGKEGSRAYYQKERVSVPAFLQENTIETTGAGDTFMGCALHYVLTHGLEELTKEVLQEMLLFANAGAALITTKKGALKVMPTQEEIRQLLS